MIKFHIDHTTPTDNQNWIFVFGSNQAGIHGAGAALVAREKYGATLGVGSGLQGRSYAIPTKNIRIRTLTSGEIENHINRFIDFSLDVQTNYWVTRVGCGLAGFDNETISRMFTKRLPELELSKNTYSFAIPWASYFNMIDLEKTDV